MPTDFADIREGLKANLDHLNDGGSWIKVSAYMIASPTPPTVQVLPSKVEYDLANSRGGDTVFMTVQAIVVENFAQPAQEKLDQLLADGGPLSMKAVIERDFTLGGVVDDLRVVSCTGYQVYSLAGRGPVLGADWEVQLLTKTV